MGRAVLLALLVAFALPMGVAGAPTGDAEPEAVAPSLQDIAILTLNGSSRAGFATASTDVATAMAVQRDAADGRIDRYALDERVQRTDSTEARQELLLEEATTVEIRIRTLRDDERELRVAYAQRQVDTETFVRRLARIHARTAELRASLDAIQIHAAADPRFSLQGQVRLLGSQLVGYSGPVRNQTVAAIRGDTPPIRLYAEASAGGSVLATLEDGRYVRVAHRADRRTPDSVNPFSLDEAASRAFFQLYPDAYNESLAPGYGQNIDGSIGGNLYLVQLSLPTGSIDAYLDDGSQNVFLEVQERQVDRLRPRPWVEESANGTRLTVNRSYRGGPLRVTVADNATGEPLQTTVVIDDARLETGLDGTAWTLAPGAVAFEVTAVGPRGNVSITVRPFAPTPVGGEG